MPEKNQTGIKKAQENKMASKMTGEKKSTKPANEGIAKPAGKPATGPTKR